jgi:Flp pilus assembly protein TadG
MTMTQLIDFRPPVRSNLMREASGQSMVELAVMMPILLMLMGYAVDFGYFFIAAANIVSAARTSTEYSIQGYQGPGQGTLAAAGPLTSATSVAGTALGDMTSLAGSSTLTTVQVCSISLGMNGTVPNCSSYGPAGTAYTPIHDPEAPRFVLQRVDVTYTVQPPIPMSFFKYSFLPLMQFHRQVSMRAMN